MDLKAAASQPTPTPGPTWLKLSSDERLALIHEALERASADFTTRVSLLEAQNDGQLILRLVNPMPASERGPFLLDMEAFLKDAVDEGITVWLAPLGDRNSLRRLRGHADKEAR